MSLIDRIKGLLSTIPRDKLQHAAAGAGVALIGCVIFSTGWAGVLFAALAGAGKEWYDAKHGGTSDFNDTIATVLGGMVLAALYGVLS